MTNNGVRPMNVVIDHVVDFFTSRPGIFLIALTMIVFLQIWLFHFSGNMNHKLKGFIFFGLLGVIYGFMIFYFRRVAW